MMAGSGALLGLPGIRVSPGWPGTAQPATLHRRPTEPGRPHLFALCLPSSPEAWIERLMQICSPERATRARRFRHEVAALRCLAAEALLHHAAKDVLKLDPRELETAVAIHGKPYFLVHPEVHFNLSHSGGWILCAVHDAPVGLDIEQESRIRPDSRSFMSPQEILQHDRLDPEEKQFHFFRLWTLKESLLKAVGSGLSHEPRSITIRLWAHGTNSEGGPSAPPGARWVLETLPMPTGVAAALCFAGPDPLA